MNILSFFYWKAEIQKKTLIIDIYQLGEISDRLATISSKAFNGCEKLFEIDIPARVTSLGNTVFYYCSSLMKVVVRSSTLKFSTEEDSLIF